MYYFQNRFVYSFHILNHTALHLINEVYSLSPLKKYIKNTLCPKMYFVDFDTMLCIGLLYCISGHNSVHFYYNVLRPSQKVDPGPGLSQGLSQNNEPEPYKKPRLGPLSITNANRRIFFTKQITDAVPYFSLEDILNKVCHEKKESCNQTVHPCEQCLIVIYHSSLHMYYLVPKTQMHHFFFHFRLSRWGSGPLNWPRVVHEWQFIVDIEQL